MEQRNRRRPFDRAQRKPGTNQRTVRWLEPFLDLTRLRASRYGAAGCRLRRTFGARAVIERDVVDLFRPKTSDEHVHQVREARSASPSLLKQLELPHEVPMMLIRQHRI